MNPFRRDPLMEAIRPAAGAPSLLPPSRFMCFRAADLMSDAVLLLTAPHQYRWIALDPTAGGFLRVSLDKPHTFTASTGNEVFDIHPGSWAPIGGRTVYIYYFSRNGGPGGFNTNDATDVRVWVTAEPTPPPLASAGLPLKMTLVVPPAGEPTAAGGADGSEGVLIPSGYNYATVHVQDNAAARIQGAESADLEIWWWDWGATLWAHHPADDFDAAGRQPATASHDAEVYHVPHNFGRIYIRNAAGAPVVWARVMLSKDGV